MSMFKIEQAELLSELRVPPSGIILETMCVLLQKRILSTKDLKLS